MVEKNTLRQVKSNDLYVLKDMICVGIDFYVRNCEEITELSEKFGECEDETFKTILSLGLKEYKSIADSLDRGRP